MTLATDIAAIAPGGTWNGTGAIYPTDGVVITKPITLRMNGSTFYNPATAPPASGGLQPLIKVHDTTDVYVEGPGTLTGGLTSGTGRETRFMVGQAGIDVISSQHVFAQNINVNNVWGDGLTLGFEPRKPPSSDVTIDGYFINGTGGIRQGVTLAYVDGIIFDNLVIASNSGIDFESDLNGVGAANVTINNYSGNGGIRMAGFLAGPVAINNPRYSGSIQLINDAANSNQTVTVTGGQILIGRQYHGTPPAGIWVHRDDVAHPGPGASTLDMKQVVVHHQPGTLPVTTGAWSVTGGGKLILDNCCVEAPLGTADAQSSVVITP